MRKNNTTKTEASPEADVTSINPSDQKGLLRRFVTHIASALRSSVTYTNACQTAADDLLALRLSFEYEGREEKTQTRKGEQVVISSIPSGIDYAGKTKDWSEARDLFWGVALGTLTVDGKRNEDTSADKVAQWTAATQKPASHFPVRKNVGKMFTAALKLHMVENGVDPNAYGFELTQNDSPRLLNLAEEAGFKVKPKAEGAGSSGAGSDDDSGDESGTPVQTSMSAGAASETALKYLQSITAMPTDVPELMSLAANLKDIEALAVSLLTAIGVYKAEPVSVTS
jgi:hypothetical protein